MLLWLKISDSTPLIPNKGDIFNIITYIPCPNWVLFIFLTSVLTRVQLECCPGHASLTDATHHVTSHKDICSKCFFLFICTILLSCLSCLCSNGTCSAKLLLNIESHSWKSMFFLNFLHCSYYHGYAIDFIYLFSLLTFCFHYIEIPLEKIFLCILKLLYLQCLD